MVLQYKVRHVKLLCFDLIFKTADFHRELFDVYGKNILGFLKFWDRWRWFSRNVRHEFASIALAINLTANRFLS